MEYMSKNIAIFNNTTGIAETMNSLFGGEGLNVIKAATLNELLSLIRYEDIHLILVDLELEGRGLQRGVEIIQYIRNSTVIPVIVISAQTVEVAKIMLLNAGADDYVTIYDSPLVLVARIKSQLSRYVDLKIRCDKPGNTYRSGDLVLDDKSYTVMVAGKNVKMTPIEFKILRLLIQEKGNVLSINEIYERIWQMPAFDAENVIAVHIRHVREKIEDNPKEPKYVTVVRGFGYKVG